MDDAEQTSFAGTITAAKAQSLEVKAEGALGTNAKFEVASAASVVLDAAQGGTAAIVAGKATDVRLTAGGDLSLSGSNLAAAQSVTVVQNEGRLDGSSIDLTGLNSLNVSGDGAKSAVDFGNLGDQANEYNLSVVASGLAAGFTAGTVDSKGDISLDFSAVSGDVQTGVITGGADVSLVASQLGDNTFGAITAAGSCARLPLIDATGRKVSRPALFSFKTLTAFLASASRRQTMFCIAAPRAVSTAVSRPRGTFMRSAATPSMPARPLFMMNLTAPL